MTEPTPVPRLEKKPRRWGSFSLRTFFILITLIACYLGYEIYAVRARQSVLKELRTNWSYSVTMADQYQANGAPGPVAKVSFLRRLLGDQAVQHISYYDHIRNEPELRRLSRTFPEAKLVSNARPPLEPCHPGCFPHGTLISTPGGLVRIEAIQEGDTVYSVTTTGEKKSLVVSSIFRTHNRLWNIETEAGLLRTTETQPLCVSITAHQPAGELQPGDRILIWHEAFSPDQELLVAEVQHTTVLSVQKTDSIVPVINLVLGNKEPFIANGYLARSKPPKDDQLVGRTIGPSQTSTSSEDGPLVHPTNHHHHEHP